MADTGGAGQSTHHDQDAQSTVLPRTESITASSVTNERRLQDAMFSFRTALRIVRRQVRLVPAPHKDDASRLSRQYRPNRLEIDVLQRVSFGAENPLGGVRFLNDTY
jgi:hypothetical protein